MTAEFRRIRTEIFGKKVCDRREVNPALGVLGSVVPGNFLGRLWDSSELEKSTRVLVD